MVSILDTFKKDKKKKVFKIHLRYDYHVKYTMFFFTATCKAKLHSH